MTVAFEWLIRFPDLLLCHKGNSYLPFIFSLSKRFWIMSFLIFWRQVCWNRLFYFYSSILWSMSEIYFRTSYKFFLSTKLIRKLVDKRPRPVSVQWEGAGCGYIRWNNIKKRITYLPRGFGWTSGRGIGNT